MIKQLILVGLGGGLGSMIRYLASWLISRQSPMNFPWGTFFVNITGCILIGLLIGLSMRYQWLDKDLRLLFITGFCGGYTTFSTFSLENMELFESGNYTLLIIYSIGSLILGITAVWLGILFAK